MKVHQFASLLKARLVRRYKRFLADVILEDGREVTVHCPNPGRMSSILPQAETVFLTDLTGQGKSQRKLDYRWELALVDSTLVVVNTQLANKVAKVLLSDDQHLRECLQISDAAVLKSEVTVMGKGDKKTRFDFSFQNPNEEPVYVEVKQASLRASDSGGSRWAAFPDAVTTRGRRHLDELTALKQNGHQACLLYIVGRNDVDRIRPADEVDPEYGDAFRRAAAAGVQMIACKIRAQQDGLYLESWLPVERNGPSTG